VYDRQAEILPHSGDGIRLLRLREEMAVGVLVSA
jgi:hypothetical protein